MESDNGSLTHNTIENFAVIPDTENHIIGSGENVQKRRHSLSISGAELCLLIISN
jgi:hypothetical protein